MNPSPHKPMCALTEPFLPCRPGPGFPEAPSFLSGNQGAEAPPLCLQEAQGLIPAILFALLRPSWLQRQVSPALPGFQSARDAGKWPLWARPPLGLGLAQKHGPCGAGMGDLTVDCSQVEYPARHSLTPTSNLSANSAGSNFIKSIQNLPDHLSTMATILVLPGPST